MVIITTIAAITSFYYHLLQIEISFGSRISLLWVSFRSHTLDRNENENVPNRDRLKLRPSDFEGEISGKSRLRNYATILSSDRIITSTSWLQTFKVL
jgi:hypothetical protein